MLQTLVKECSKYLGSSSLIRHLRIYEVSGYIKHAQAASNRPSPELRTPMPVASDVAMEELRFLMFSPIFIAISTVACP